MKFIDETNQIKIKNSEKKWISIEYLNSRIDFIFKIF